MKNRYAPPKAPLEAIKAFPIVDNQNNNSNLNEIFKDSPNGEEAHVLWLSVEDIAVSKQVREEFEDEENSLQDLADHIKEHGLMQPILVRPGTFGRYELIAGERRLRAHKLAKLMQIPAYVRELTDEQAQDAQFAENIHRKNLTQIEEAKKIQHDIDKLGSVEAVLAKYKKNRGWLSKKMSLLNLPDQAKRLVNENISADIEVINSVKTIEKLDPNKAKEVVDQLKAKRGSDNARELVDAVKKTVKPVNKLGQPTLKEEEKTASTSELVTATKRNRAAEQPSPVVSIFPTLPVKKATDEEAILNTIFKKLTFDAMSSEAVFAAITPDEMTLIERQLQPYFDEGLKASLGEAGLLKHLRTGVFGSEGSSSFALLAYCQGLRKNTKLNVLETLQAVNS